MRALVVLLLLAGCAPARPIPPPPPQPVRDADYRVVRPVIPAPETFEREPEVTPPLTRATLPVPPPPRSDPVWDENPYAGVSGPPKAAPPRNFPVPPLTLPKRGTPNG